MTVELNSIDSVIVTARALLGALLAFLVIGLGGPLPVQAQERPVLPSDAHPSVRSQEGIPIARMTPVESEALPPSDDGRIGPHPYGTVLDTRLTPTEDGLWEALPSGDWLWRLRLQSDEATSLSVAFTRFQLPTGAEVFVYGADEGDIRGPYTNDDGTGDQHWTPLVHGDEITIEVQVPQGQRSALDLEIGRVVHGIRSIFPSTQRDQLSKSGTCNLDVACDEADPWRNQVRSVGLYSFEEDGVAYVCTGSLVNNTAEDKTPYFLTAEHCVSTPEIASTMVFYWNYQNATCRTPGTPENGTVTDDSPTDQTSTGAILRARYGNSHDENIIYGKPDLTLVEVDDEIPDTYDLYLSGWSREGQATARSVSIHHPVGQGKRISFDRDSTAITAYGDDNGGNTHLRIGNWDVGTTEPGSSGAPLFNTDHQTVGVLSGGWAGCENDGDAEDNNRPDWYGRLAPGFESGDYEGATFADFLDPLNTGVDTLGGLPQSPGADVVPPGRIRDFRVYRVDTQRRQVTLRWTASGDDRYQGTATSYDLRFDTTRIETATDFRSAQRVTDLPPPKSAGQTETVVVDAADGLKADRTYSFAIVAVDDAGNRSPLTTTDRRPSLVQDIEIGPGGVSSGAGRAVAETRFVLNESQSVRLVLYDLLGRRVRSVFDEYVDEGFEQVVRFETRSLSSGPYFLRFVGETFTTSRKFTVVN